jgi:hypothetical protein
MMFLDKTPYSLVQNHKMVCTWKGEILYITFQPISTEYTTSSGWSEENLLILVHFPFSSSDLDSFLQHS